MPNGSTLEYIVDPILPVGQVHLFHGDSGANKTTMLAQMLRQIQNAEPVFGYPSVAVPMIYISLDHDEGDTIGRFQAAGLTDLERYYLDEVPNVDINHCWNLIKPHHKLIIIEGIAAIAGKEGRDLNDYIKVRSFLALLKQRIRPHGQAIIGTTHESKPGKAGPQASIRQRILGSVAWGAYASTLIGIERGPEGGGHRKIYLAPRRGPEAELEADLTNGAIVMRPPKEQDAAASETPDLTTAILSMQTGQEFPTKWVMEIARLTQTKERSAERILFRMVQDGWVERLEKGMFRRTSKQSA